MNCTKSSLPNLTFPQIERLQKATKALEKLQNGNGRFLSLAGKILALNTYIYTYVFSTVWNNAWLIDIKNS